MKHVFVPIVLLTFLCSSSIAQIYNRPAPPGNVQALEILGAPSEGQTVDLRVSAAPGSCVTFIFGTATDSIDLPLGFRFEIDPSSVFALETVFADATGLASRQFTLPAVMPGLFVVVQACIVDPQAALHLSNRSDVFAIALVIPPTSFLNVNPIPSPTALTQLMVTGRASTPGSAILIEGGTNQVTTTASLGGGDEFAATVFLTTNAANALYFTETTTGGVELPPVTRTVVQDSQPPALFIDFPANGASLVGSAVTVAGRISDTLSGFTSMSVDVNGVVATVNVGQGPNGTFEVIGVPLAAPGTPTVITATGTDVVGNTASTQVTVSAIVPQGLQLSASSGGGQSGAIETVLPQPIVVEVVDALGAPVPNKLVTFRVRRSNGGLAATPGAPGTTLLQVPTGANGRAQAFWRLGSDAGAGNNRVEATAGGIMGAAYFCASAQPGPAAQINVSTGNNQVASAGAPAPRALEAWVSDSCNGIAGVPVTFTVVRGGGYLTTGGSFPTTVSTVTTDQTGHASTNLVLGPGPGNNVVTAMFAGGVQAARFVCLGLGVASAGTSISGIVIDNAELPIEGATCALTVGATTFPSVVTDTAGRFSISSITATGPAHLHVEGATATSVGGIPISSGTFPPLEYEVLVVPGAANTLARPVVLPRLRPENVKIYDVANDLVLTVDGIDGLSMTIRAGSMTIDGSPAPAGTEVSLNQVHVDNIPMPMNDGAFPPFAWTLQPHGAHFDPPIEITYPNMTGLPPGSVTYFLSFNHATLRFEIVATGTVSEDGSTITTDSGSGLSVSGWGCNCPPYSVTADCMDEDDDDCSTAAVLAAQATLAAVAAGFAFLPPLTPIVGGNYAGQHLLHFLGNSGSDRFYGDGSPPVEQIKTFPAFLADHQTLVCQIRAMVQVAGGTSISGGVMSFGGISFYTSGSFPTTQLSAGIGALSQGYSGTYSTIMIDTVNQRFTGTVSYSMVDHYMFDPTDCAFGGFDAVACFLQECGEAAGYFNHFDFTITIDEPITGPTTGPAPIAVNDPPTWVLGPPLSPEFTLTVGGQTAVPNADGTFVVPNISSADSFGPGGPGSAPDFVSDNFVKVEGMGVVQGEVVYVSSAPFRFSQGQDVEIAASDLVFSSDPPINPESLTLAIQDGILDMPGQTTTAATTAVYADGETADVSLVTDFTTYRTSNPAVATVDANGGITAVENGTAFITATNNGATAVAQVVVSLGDPFTTVTGVARFDDGTPASGAFVQTFGLTTTAGSQGDFSLSGVPTQLGPISVSATIVSGGVPFAGLSGQAPPIPGGFTDVGFIVLLAAIANGGFESGSFAGFNTSGNASIVNNLGSVLPPEGSFMAFLSTGPTGSLGQLTIPNLLVPAGATGFAFDFNFLSDELDQSPAFNDTFVATMTPAGGTPIMIVSVSKNDLVNGLLPTLPAPAGFDGMTGFMTALANVAALAGTPVTLDFCFSVTDVGDTAVDSAVLLDDLRFTSGGL